jgi:hypothetical protein
MPPAGFEPAIPTVERPQTSALDRVSTEIGREVLTTCISLELQELCTI